MKASTQILIIGPGRLGQCMARWLTAAGRSVRLIGKQETIPPAPITWLTVPDRAISQVAEQVPRGGVVLHASGATDLTPLQSHTKIGSLHPLMTFTGTEKRSDMPKRIPAAISGCETAKATARSLAQDLGFEVFDFEGDRRIYHAAAVLSGNFATILLANAATLLASQGIAERMLGICWHRWPFVQSKMRAWPTQRMCSPARLRAAMIRSFRHTNKRSRASPLNNRPVRGTAS